MLHLINDQCTDVKGFAQLADVLKHYTDAVTGSTSARVLLNA